VWADSTGDEFWSTGPHQFLIRAAGGVGIGTNSPQAQLHVAAGGTLIPVRVDNTAAYGGPAIQVEQAYPTDVAYPVYGADIKVAGATAYGLYAETTQVDGDTTYGVYGKSASISATGYGYGGYFVSEGTNNGAGVYGRHPVRGVYGTTTGNGVGVYGRVTGATGRAVQGLALTSGYGPSYGGYFSSSGTDGIGLYGKAGGSAGRGVIGEATGTYGIGVYGAGDTGVKADATEEGGYALWADVSAGNGTAIYARSGASGGSAGHFVGNVQICDRSSGTTVIELGTGLDYAEGFDVVEGDDVRPGTVLVIDPEHPGQLAVARHAYDCKVAGIVAGANGLGSAVKLGSSQFDHDVALAGRVYCNAVAFDAPIEPGDLLTTSNVPGHAMKVQDHSRASGATLGKAMERLDAGRQGQILVLVTLQ
jgi:hypothetical protein